MLKAAGTRISWAPRSPMTRKNSAKRISKQMASPSFPSAVSTTVIWLPAVRVSDSINRWPPGTSMSKR